MLIPSGHCLIERLFALTRCFYSRRYDFPVSFLSYNSTNPRVDIGGSSSDNSCFLFEALSANSQMLKMSINVGNCRKLPSQPVFVGCHCRIMCKKGESICKCFLAKNVDEMERIERKKLRKLKKFFLTLYVPIVSRYLLMILFGGIISTTCMSVKFQQKLVFYTKKAR